MSGCRAAAPAATSAGPPTTGHISGGLVSLCSKTQGAFSPTASVIAGLKKKAVWAASWCAIRTIVRSASGGPSSREHVVGAALREQPAEPPPARRQLVGDQGGRSRAGRRGEQPRGAPAAPRREAGESRRRRPAGRSTTRRCRWPPAPPRPAPSRTPSSRRAPASHSAARRSPSEADSRSKAQSSSRRSRIQAASGGVETLVGTSVAIRENYESSSTGGSFRENRHPQPKIREWLPPA